MASISAFNYTIRTRAEPVAFVKCQDCVFWLHVDTSLVQDSKGNKIGDMLRGVCRASAPTHDGFPPANVWPASEAGCGYGLKPEAKEPSDG